jgi:hypothetical protein
VGRVEDAIEILEHVLKVREEDKLGTANPDVGGAAGRAAGRSRNRKQKSLQNLIGTKKQTARSWSNFGFRSCARTQPTWGLH